MCMCTHMHKLCLCVCAFKIVFESKKKGLNLSFMIILPTLHFNILFCLFVFNFSYSWKLFRLQGLLLLLVHMYFVHS